MLIIYELLLWLCLIGGSVYLLVDWLLEQREESRLKPKRQKRRRPAPHCRRSRRCGGIRNG